MKSFYEFNRGNPEDRLEQYKLYPKMALFHIALREELGEEEYQEFYRAEKEAQKRFAPMFHQTPSKWISA
ncbi:MAG: hypothetical protein LPK07_07605 [Hymenobacteraceae bacterium]|nr:hypothetical protein [Hymenobacteraceae bacterium]MDX5481534.1 hypothetical protein [Hymenobacteraceae bacterium]